MHELYPILKRQRKLGAFPTADAMRAAKAAALTASVTSASVTLDSNLPATPSVPVIAEPEKLEPPKPMAKSKKQNDRAAKK